MTQDHSTQYSKTAIALHWLHALLIVAILVIGWIMVDLHEESPDRPQMYGLHKSLGLCAMMLILLRIFWRWTHQPPPLTEGTSLQIKAANLTHHLLYTLLFLIPVMGILLSSFTKYPTRFFGLKLPRLFDPNQDLNALFKSFHLYLGWLLVALLVLHIGAALYHRFVKKDQVLQRMLPGHKK